MNLNLNLMKSLNLIKLMPDNLDNENELSEDDQDDEQEMKPLIIYIMKTTINSNSI